VLFGVRKIPKQKFEEVHSVEERTLNRLPEYRCGVESPKKDVAADLVQVTLRLGPNHVALNLKFRVDADRGTLREFQGVAVQCPDFEIGLRSKHAVQIAQEFLIEETMKLDLRILIAHRRLPMALRALTAG
jgi:hypothetical protein